MVPVLVVSLTVADLVAGKQRVVALREPLVAVAREHHLALGLLGAVALDAVLVENRLDIARVVDHLGNVRNRFDLAGGTCGGQ